MSDFRASTAASASGMQAQANRLRHVSENIANVDTPAIAEKSCPLIRWSTAAGPPGRWKLAR